MFRFLRNWLDRRVLERNSITRSEWNAAYASLPLLRGLDADDRRELEKLAVLFLHRKSIVGARDLEISRHMTLVIALQACLPILGLGLEAYSGWSTVIVYPSGFAPRRVERDEFGVEHHWDDELSGEAWERGPVILSWDETEHAGLFDGYNLVIHEFAHKLDMQNGEANGFPPLHRGMDAAAWTRIFCSAFEDFERRCERGEDLGIDDYAATSPAEFFAVMSEVFFERPDLLQRSYTEIYDQLRQYYRQHPLQRL